MDARTLAKSAKALILASGLIVASTIVGAAQDALIPLGTAATVALNSWYVAAPTGQPLLGGHTFDLTAGNFILLGNGQSVSFTGSYPGTKGAYLLLNSSNTYSWYTGMPVGRVVLTFSDGTTQATDLIEGTNIREWRISAGATVNTLVAGAGTAPVWTGTAQPSMGGGTAVIDMLSIPVATAGKTLTAVTLNDTNTWGALHIQLAGLTVDYTACSMPGNSCNTPAAQHSQAPKHAESANFTGTSPSQGQSSQSADAGVNTPAMTGEHPAK